MKEARVVVNRRGKFFVTVIKHEQRLALRIEINTPLDGKRIGFRNVERRVISIIDDDHELAGISRNVNRQILGGDECAGAIYAHATDLAAGELRAFGVFNADGSAKVHLRRGDLKRDAAQGHSIRGGTGNQGQMPLLLRSGARTEFSPSGPLLVQVVDRGSFNLLRADARREPDVEITEAGSWELQLPIGTKLFLGEVVER